jgi:hypothetical protein
MLDPMRVGRVTAVLAALAIASSACGSGTGSPTSPRDSTPDVPSTGPPPGPINAGPYLVTGAVTDATTGGAVPAVQIRAGDTLVGVADGAGTFSAGFHVSGVNRTILSAPGFVTRETGLQAPSLNLQLSLIPESFDLPAFNQMFRHSAVGLTRWTAAPALVLERRVLQFPQAPGANPCAASYQALDETIDDVAASSIIADMWDGYDILTNGRLGALASVSSRTSGAGTAVSLRQPGAIVVSRQAGLTAATRFWGYACWSTSADGEVTAGHIILDSGFETSTNPLQAPFRRSLRMHEIGHTLGANHVTTGRESVMNNDARTEPNDFDREAARIAALRPTGNRTPDVDPASHTAVTSAARATRPVVWHGAG